MPVRSTHIERFEAEYVLPAGIADPEEVQRRLDGIVAAEIERVWDEETGALDEGEMIYFIERVHVDLNLSVTGMDDRVMARAWARAIQQEIARTIARNEPGVVVFENRADYLAAFLHDLLHGAAWGRWYYHEFAEQASRTVPSAILNVLTADADTGRDAMILMAVRGGLDLLLATLSDDEVEIVVERCLLPVSPRVRMPRMLPAWLAGLREVVAEQPRAAGAWGRDLARIYTRLLGRHPELGPDVNLARFVGDLLRLRDQMQERSTGRRVLSLLEREMLDEAVAVLTAGGSGGMGAGGDGSVFQRQMVEMLRDLMRETSAPESAALLRDLGSEQSMASRRIVTPFGGLFLLAPTIVEVGLHTMLKEVTTSGTMGRETSGEGVVREEEALLLWLMLAQCLGADQIARALRDDGLRLLAGCAARLTRNNIDRYCNLESTPTFVPILLSHSNELILGGRATLAPTEEQVEACILGGADEPLIPFRPLDDALAVASAILMRGFAARLGAFSASSAAYLRRNFLMSHAEVEVSDSAILVRFLSSPLQMVLQMAGYGSMRTVLPWLGDRELSFTFES
ncbi:MAG TPA: hypothetical protein VHI13_17085 [Candidatus Kapabacteria bacterium]|nr:hypothetical protein [Candidatus Kapabacteria bacterium]